MSKSFQIINGDFAIGAGRSYAIISGKDKLMQDLKFWVTERIGTDPLLPTYGSALDGGIIDGQVQESYIGQLATPDNLSQIRAEVLRILNNYQADQLNKMRDEATVYNGQTTIAKDEILDQVLSVQTAQVGTTILVQAVITTLAGSTLTLTIPLTNG